MVSFTEQHLCAAKYVHESVYKIVVLVCVCVCVCVVCVCVRVRVFVRVRICTPVVDMHIGLWGNRFLKFQRKRSLILSLSFLSMDSIECVFLPFTFQQMKL